jgi:hypothetical protein
MNLVIEGQDGPFTIVELDEGGADEWGDILDMLEENVLFSVAVEVRLQWATGGEVLSSYEDYPSLCTIFEDGTVQFSGYLEDGTAVNSIPVQYEDIMELIETKFHSNDDSPLFVGSDILSLEEQYSKVAQSNSH